MLPQDACDLDHRDRPWRLAAGYGYVSTGLRLSDGLAGFTEQVATLRLTRRLDEQRSWGAGLGGIAAGRLSMPGEAWAMGPGAIVDGMMTWVLRDGATGGPWVTGTASASVGVARAKREGGGRADTTIVSADVRGSVVAGTVLFGRFAPYAACSLFGGPVFMPRGGGRVVAGDRTHVRPALGLVVLLPWHLDASVDVAPVGEAGVVASVGTAF